MYRWESTQNKISKRKWLDYEALLLEGIEERKLISDLITNLDIY